MFVLLFSIVAFASPAKYVSVVLLMDNGDDKQVVTTIYTTLMAAEKVANLLNVELIADDVQDDIFVFAVKSQEQMDITMKMFDEEGYELAAHRQLQINDGNNYNALNVTSLEDGTYIFKLTDGKGNEITKEVTIKH
jgi:hypothetical protein